MALVWHTEPSPAALAETLAAWLGARLAEAVAKRGVAFLAVSGGNTPKLLFQKLSAVEIDWQNVVVTLIDERLVDPASPRSNQGLVQQMLLQNAAAAARFLPLYHGVAEPLEAARRAEQQLADAPWPLDVAVLGMGGDGHTASMFPDAPNLDVLLAPAGKRRVEAVEAASAGEPRLTMTLPAIVSARSVVLHIEGAEKRRVLEEALDQEGEGRLPIARVLAGCPQAELFWTGG